MKAKIHVSAAILATLCIITFFGITLSVELIGSLEQVARVKSLIVFPGLFILIPAMAITGATGAALAKHRKGRLIQEKQKRMKIIAANGLLILIPSALVLHYWASLGQFNLAFYTVQVLELSAGFINASLMIMNANKGRKLAHK